MVFVPLSQHILEDCSIIYLITMLTSYKYKKENHSIYIEYLHNSSCTCKVHTFFLLSLIQVVGHL